MPRSAPTKLTAVVAGQYGDVWRRTVGAEGATDMIEIAMRLGSV
jgi:hypothetical protein